MNEKKNWCQKEFYETYFDKNLLDIIAKAIRVCKQRVAFSPFADLIKS